MKNWSDNVVKKIKKIGSDIRKSSEDSKKKNKKESIVVALPEVKATTVDVSMRSVIKATVAVLLVIVLFQFVYDIGYILTMFFVAFLLAAALDPYVDRLSGVMPRTLSVVIVFGLLLALFGLFINNVVTILATQISEIATSIGQFVVNIGSNGAHTPISDFLQPYIDKVYETVDVQTAAGQIQTAFSAISNQLVSISVGLFNLLIVLILTFFMTVEEASIEQFYMSLFPAKYGEYVGTKMSAVKHQIGLWIRGQLMVSIVAALMSYIVLVILGIEYALSLSIIAGVAMVIPVVGRVFAWVVTFPIVFNQSPSLAVWMSIMYLIIQQVENNLLVPLIMKRAVGLSPIIIIFAMMVGNHYMQILGLIISVPLATTIALFVKDYTSKSK